MASPDELPTFGSPTPMDHRIKEATSLLEMDSGQKLRPVDLARQLGLSVSRLQHLFKQGLGITIVEYQRRLRLDRACNLLETTLLSVKQVAAQVGARDTSHFIRDFTKYKGLSPRRYRVNFVTDRTAQ